LASSSLSERDCFSAGEIGDKLMPCLSHSSELIAGSSIVGNTVSNHVNDQDEALPTIDAIPAQVGKPQAAALDNGYWSATNVEELQERGVEPYIATGRNSHHRSWQERFAQEPEPPPQDASLIVQMAYKLKTDIGKQVYGLQVHGGAGHRHHQGDAGLSAVLVARHGGGDRGVVFGVPGLQSEAVASDHGYRFRSGGLRPN